MSKLTCAAFLFSATLALAQEPAAPTVTPPPRAIKSALDYISTQRLLADIKTLSSDEFEGRAPGTPGETKTVNWLVEQFRSAGLQPANPNGSWFQEVPMAAITAVDPKISFQSGEQTLAASFPSNCVIWSKRQVPEIEVTNSEVIFAGYGVVAPEYGWDDFKGVDVKGNTILVLINDPQVVEERNPERLDPYMFKGRAMTYYGRWTYKYEIGAKKGAAAVIIVHETPTAGYPWSVVVDSNSRENFDLESPDKNMSRCAVEGWITLEEASKVLASTGFDYGALKRRAATKEFTPMPLGIKASFALKNQIRSARSVNVVGQLEGSSRRLRHEQVVYSAHWDHLGKQGDQIFHGALDNASGVAGLLELARAYKQLSSPPARTVVFLSVTAEEKGLLGSRYFARHPFQSISNVIADLNMDGLNPWGRTSDIEIIGRGNSSLEDLLTAASTARGRKVVNESKPERGFFYRSDQFEFAKVGVPVIYFKAGTNYVGKPDTFGNDKIEEYVAHDYHKPSDVIHSDWDLTGAVEDLRLLLQVGWTAAESKQHPFLKSESEFKAEAAKRLFE